MENLFENTFLLDDKTAYIGRNIWKKIVANSSDKSFK